MSIKNAIVVSMFIGSTSFRSCRRCRALAYGLMIAYTSAYVKPFFLFFQNFFAPVWGAFFVLFFGHLALFCGHLASNFALLLDFSEFLSYAFLR